MAKTGPKSGKGEKSVWHFDSGTNADLSQPQRASEATLAPSFASLQLKKFELEFSVDPLFKKASADFDEGGAKGLLLNHLSIDAEGRIVFDSSDDANDATAEVDDTKDEASQDPNSEKKPGLVDIDMVALGSAFFADLSQLDEHDICPSLKNFDQGDPAGSLEIPFLKAPEDWRQERSASREEGSALGDQTGIFLDEDNAAGFDDDDGLLVGFDTGGDAGFGEGGEAWAKSAAIEPQVRLHDRGYEEGIRPIEGGADVGSFDPKSNSYGVSLRHNEKGVDHEDIMSYFDNALKKNWAGPEHWRIRRIKDVTKPASAPTRRKEKEPFEIDFLSPLNQTLAEIMYTPAASNSAICMPKSQRTSKTRNLLPDDKHFNSRQLLQLFLKPKARMGSRRGGFGGAKTYRAPQEDPMPEGDIDEAYWASKENAMQQATPDEDVPQGNYDANFFQDDALPAPGGPPDDDDFADAREIFSPETEGALGAQSQGIDGTLNANGNQEEAFGTQLVTQSSRLRPEYVQYARVAKKVDVRRLKEELWKGIGFEKVCISHL